MSSNDGQSRNTGHKPPSVVNVGAITTVDLGFLPEGERNALMSDYARGVLDVAKKAHELHLDVEVLKSTLGNLARTTKEVSESGNSVTITHSQTTKIGRTEVKMGNTDEAKSGKLTSSQSGITDWNPYYIFAAIAAIVLIGFVFARH